MPILGLIGLFTVIVLGLTLIIKLRLIEQLNNTVSYFKKSLEEMDEQAKLIVRTDLELNKIQDELDKKITGLYALQKISQDISKTLDQNEIFRRIGPEHIQEIGFQKAIIFMQKELNLAHLKHQIGFDEASARAIEDKFTREGIFELLKEKSLAFSSLSKKPEIGMLISLIIDITGLNSFVVSPISKKEGFCGFILLGNESAQAPITEGDEELIAVLATQIGQALENAELFEAAYSQHQELEKKVIERTRELSGAINEIELVSKRKTEFVSAVSHELRTPLTSIKGYAAILLSEKLGTVPPAIKERLEKINKHSDELTHMVNDLLDIARIESGKAEMTLEALDITQTAHSVIELLNPQLKEKAINVQTNIPQELSYALADKSQVSRVFINIIGNAIKFVPAENGTINISAFESADAIQINIADNGIGMSEHDVEHIFDEFYRVDNLINQKTKGTGLGLTLVRNIIQAHKGKIWVEARQGRGSTFSFTLPKCKR
jgi:signal transduction histidine kinase